MINLNIKIEGVDKINLNVELKSILDESANFLLGRVLSRFMSETSPDGTPWIPSKAGMARKLKGKGGTLYDTGRLYHSIQVYSDGDERRISTNAPYAEKMSSGGGKLPPRPFMGFSDEDFSLVNALVASRLSIL